MQQTRLNTLVNFITGNIRQLFSNPWRWASLILISLLLGFFAGSAISTTAGQAAAWDVPSAIVLLLITELVSSFVYSRNRRKGSGNVALRPPQGTSSRSLFWDVLNVFKIGLIYSLYLEALKLGS